MKTINVMVRDKIASAVGDIVYICGNSDYIINFDFDAEWDDYDVKTARFVHDGTYTDVVFTGEQCAMPVIHKAYGIYVGVYAGDLRTTTPAHIPSAASILSAEGTPAAPPDDVYAQITALCNEAVSEAKSVREDADAGKFNGAPGKTPVAGTDYFTEADKQAIAAEAAKEVGFPKPTPSDNGKFLGCEGGKAAWMPVEASGGGATEETWELIDTIPLVKDTVVYEIASFEKYKKIAVTTTKRLIQGTSSGFGWCSFMSGPNTIFRSTINSSFFTYAQTAVVIIGDGNLLKFINYYTNNKQLMQSIFYNYYLFDGNYIGKTMRISLPEEDASNVSEGVAFNVYGVRR